MAAIIELVLPLGWRVTTIEKPIVLLGLKVKTIIELALPLRWRVEDIIELVLPLG